MSPKTPTEPVVKKDQHSHLPLLAAVFGTLLMLTILTVIASGINFGDDWLNILVAMGIASVKSWIVIYYFMHLKWESKLIKVYAFLSIPFLFLMLFSDIVDVAARILEGQFF